MYATYPLIMTRSKQPLFFLTILHQKLRRFCMSFQHTLSFGLWNVLPGCAVFHCCLFWPKGMCRMKNSIPVQIPCPQPPAEPSDNRDINCLFHTCCLFGPAFGCCTLQMLVKVFLCSSFFTCFWKLCVCFTYSSFEKILPKCKIKGEITERYFLPSSVNIWSIFHNLREVSWYQKKQEISHILDIWGYSVNFVFALPHLQITWYANQTLVFCPGLLSIKRRLLIANIPKSCTLSVLNFKASALLDRHLDRYSIVLTEIFLYNSTFAYDCALDG